MHIFNTKMAGSKAIVMGLVCLFMTNNVSFSQGYNLIYRNTHTLAPYLINGPLVHIEEINGVLKVVESEDEIKQEHMGFREAAGFYYLSGVIADKLEAHAENLNDLSEDELKASIEEDVNASNMTTGRFIWKKLYKQGNTFCMPYDSGILGDKRKLIARYFLPDQDPPEARGEIYLSFGKAGIIFEIIDPEKPSPEKITKKKRPDGSPYQIYRFLLQEAKDRTWVTPEDIKPKTEGRDADKTLTVRTIAKDLNVLTYLGLAEKKGKGRDAEYKPVKLTRYKWIIAKPILEGLGDDPRKPAIEKAKERLGLLFRSFDELTNVAKNLLNVQRDLYDNLAKGDPELYLEKVKEVFGDPKKNEKGSAEKEMEKGRTLRALIREHLAPKEILLRNKGLEALEMGIVDAMKEKAHVVVNILGRPGAGKTTISNVIGSGIDDISSEETMIIHSDQFGDNVKIMNMLIENKGILNKPLLSLSEKEFNLLGVVAKEIYMPWPAARRGGYSFLNYYRKFRKRLEGFGTTDTVRKKELWEMDHVHTALIDLSDPELESVRKLAVSNGIALRLFEENMDKSLWEIFREVECGEFLGSVKDDKAALDPVKLFIVEGTFSCQGHKLFDPEPERLKSDISVFIEVDEETRELRIKQRAEEGWEMDVLDMPPNDIIYSPTVDMLRESADIVIDNNQETNEYQIVKMAGIKTQFGITTETAKHLLTREFIQGLKGTDVFVLPSELFRGGRNYADIEFVIYFNTFLKQGMRVTLVGTPEQLENFKIYMGNSLFNPDESSERVRSYDEDLRKFFKTTTELYALKDKSGKILSLENYIDFVPFENGEAMIGKEDRKIKINMLKLNKFSIVEIGRETEPVTVELDYRAPSVAMPPISERFKKALTEAPEQRFAITTLGTSHGFDVAGDYTNFIVWLEGEGILVDPSPQALEYIDRLGIDEDLIPYVFLTHTHADHDSGTLRKILKKRRIKLIATKPVFDSFIEKTRVLVGSDSDATRWVEHIEVKSGRGNEFELELSNGAYATIAVRWNLHSIPTNGLKITYGDYVFGYSGDIEYDKEKIQGLLKDGKITEEQAHDLLFFFWDANGKPKVDLLFHEAGMKPLHTPIANIGEFPSAVREVTRLVHIADKDVPEDAVVKKAKGFETFVLIESDEQSRLRSILKPIDIAAMYIANLTPSKKAEIYEKGTIKEFKKGDLIVHEGDEVDDASEFYIILSGRCEVQTADQPRLIAGDCIGDWAFETNKVRSASVIAESDVTVIALNRVQYDSIIKSEESTREVKLIKKNIGLIQAWVRHTSEEEIYSLSSYSMKHLSVKLQRRKYKKGEIIIKQGEKGEEFFIIDSGSVTVYDESVSPVKRKATFGGKGRYFGETAFLSEDNNLRNATVVAETDLDVAVMSKEDFDKVLHDYPGLHYALKKYSDKRKNAWREEVPPITKKREEKVSRDFVKDIYKRIRAIETGRQGEKIVIGIDTSWIPKVQGSLQSLLSEIYGLRDIDPERIIIVRGNNGRELARDIMKEIEDHPESNAPNVIVFGKASDIRFGEFRELESSKAERKALLVGIDPKNLMEEVPAGKANYIRVIEMIKAALELANMDEEPDTMSIPGMENAYRIGPRRWLFIPKAEHLPIERINELYEAQLTAMKDA